MANPGVLSYSEWVECFARLGFWHFQNHLQQHPCPSIECMDFGWLKASEGMNEIENEEWARVMDILG